MKENTLLIYKYTIDTQKKEKTSKTNYNKLLKYSENSQNQHYIK